MFDQVYARLRKLNKKTPAPQHAGASVITNLGVNLFGFVSRARIEQAVFFLTEL